MYSSILQKIPVAVAGILLIVAAMTIYFRLKNVTRSEAVKIFKNTKYLKAWVLIFAVVLTGVFGIFNHMKSKQSVKAVIALNYSEASQAQNSNGTRYNMAEIICDEVVEKAIEMGAFENVTVKQLKKCLSFYPYVQGDVNDKSNYHISTEFVVEYHASKHTDHLDAENVINASAGKLLRGVKLFDIYRGTGVPEGKKSMAFSLELRADDRTLTDNDSEQVIAKVLKALSEKLDAVLR